MRDEHDREAEPLAQFGEQLQHLRLHRDVERRHRLVGDEHLGFERERARQADALALPAGELVRIAIRRRGIEADEREQFLGARQRLVARRAVDDEPLRDQRRRRCGAG